MRQNPTAVLELFTSQGCSSCPAADALLTELSQKRNIIALAYHVDYWDYIGWPDTFGAAANSDHQRDYAQRWGSSRIFTPQLVVNGAEGRRRLAQAGSATSPSRTPRLPCRSSLDDRTATCSRSQIGPRPGHGEAVVWLVTFIDRADVAIERGENKGKKIAYTQIVTGRQVLGMWEPATGAQLKLPLAEVLDRGRQRRRRSWCSRTATACPAPSSAPPRFHADQPAANRQTKLPPAGGRAGAE